MDGTRLGWKLVSVLGLLIVVSGLSRAEGPSSQKRGLRVFHVGNSHTDQAYGMHDIARARGYSSAMYKRHMIPGAGLSWLWTFMKQETVDEITKEKWDVLTLQTSTGKATSVENTVRYGAGYRKGEGYASLIYEGSPDCQVYLFDSYPIRSARGSSKDLSPEEKWMQPQKTKNGVVPAPRDLTEAAADAITALYPHHKPCLIIPVGIVMCKLDRAMKEGKVPGYTSVYEFLEDKSHLNNDGKYVEAVTFFATIYKEDPHGVITEGLKFWRGPYGVKKEFAQAVWDVVWDVVRSYRYTGVHPDGPVTLGKPRLKPAPLGSAYSVFIPATGGSGKFTWALTSGALPPGLKLNPDTGEISGQPTAEGVYKFEITVSDKDPDKPKVDKRVYELAVPMPGVPEVASDKLEPAYVGVDYYERIRINGGYGAVTFSVEKNSLPSGLRLNPDTGEITGIPTAVGTKQVKIHLVDKKGRSSSKVLELRVSDRPIHGAVCGVYYQSFASVADYKKYLRDEVGITRNFTTEMVPDPAQQPFALRFVSNIRIETPGEYTFYIEACNAAVLDIDGKRIVDKDYFESHKKVKPKAGTVKLAAGVHPIEVILYRRGLGQRQYAKWSFSWSGPGIDRQPIPDNVLLLDGK